MRRVERSLVIGQIPPPVGGVTTYCLGLVRHLETIGEDVSLVQPRPRRLISLPRWIWDVLRLSLTSRGTAWINFSSTIGWGDVIRLTLATVLFGRCHLVWVPHSGAFVNDLRALGRVQSRLLRMTARHVGEVYAFTDASAAAMEEVWADLPARRTSPFFEADLPVRSAGPTCSSTGPRVLMSGYPTRTYGHEAVLEAMESLDSGAHLCVYVYGLHHVDEPYWTDVVHRIRDLPFACLRTETDRQSFIGALAAADVYVRNTTHDSFGLAMFEADAVGTPVVASAVAGRPSAFECFAVDDHDAIAAAIKRVVADRRGRASPRHAPNDASVAIGASLSANDAR